MIVNQVRGVQSSSGAPARLSFLLPRGDISTGRILPPHGRDRGSSPRRSTRTSRRSWVSVCKTPHGHPLFVRRFRDRSSTGRAPDRQSGGSRFDSDRFHRAFGLRGRRPLCCSGPDSGAPAWYAGDGECNSREQLSLGDGPEARTWSNGQDGRTPPCRRRFDSCCPLLFTCGGSSMVEREAAKLATGVRFPFTAPSVTRTWPRGRATGLHPVHAGSTPAVRSLSRSSGEARQSANRGPGSDSRPALHVTSPPLISSRLGAWLSLARAPVWGTGDCRFESGRPDRPRTPSPACGRERGFRPHLLAGQGNRILNPGTRVQIPLGTPGRHADLLAFPEARAPAAEPTNVGRRAPLARRPSSPCPGGQAPCYERGHRGSTPRREATPSLWRHQTQASEACRPGFDSRRGLRREGRSLARPITSPPQVRFLPLLPRRLTVRGGPHEAVREGSTPSVATIWVWLNLVERRLREPETGGSNPPTQTTRDERAGERIGATSRPRRVQSPGPAPRRRSPMAGGHRLRSGTVWVRLPPPAPASRRGLRGRTVR